MIHWSKDYLWLVKVLLKRSVDVGAVRKTKILPCKIEDKKGMLKNGRCLGVRHKQQ